MKRKCKHIASSKNRKKSVYIDEDNSEEILNYIRQDTRHLKKFQYILEIILEGHRNPELYDKEDINSRCKDVTSMKFFKGQENDRIYCKEITTDKGEFIVVASILHLKKKTQKNSKIEKTIIEKVGGYKYEF